jgi:hypothetical protein
MKLADFVVAPQRSTSSGAPRGAAARSSDVNGLLDDDGYSRRGWPVVAQESGRSWRGESRRE